jgi:hypothetical protein
MAMYVGLDVSLKSTSICAVEGDGSGGTAASSASRSVTDRSRLSDSARRQAGKVLLPPTSSGLMRSMIMLITKHTGFDASTHGAVHGPCASR